MFLCRTMKMAPRPVLLCGGPKESGALVLFTRCRWQSGDNVDFDLDIPPSDESESIGHRPSRPGRVNSKLLADSCRRISLAL